MKVSSQKEFTCTTNNSAWPINNSNCYAETYEGLQSLGDTLYDKCRLSLYLVTPQETFIETLQDVPNIVYKVSGYLNLFTR